MGFPHSDLYQSVSGVFEFDRDGSHEIRPLFQGVFPVFMKGFPSLVEHSVYFCRGGIFEHGLWFWAKARVNYFLFSPD